ncbi:hypothetical protein OXPF_06170 [Oxobacter pfennigii]|uniref:Peptidase S8/S53 domain-containing protein n=1 Tax=Oxobacter pfennigii TaxID=36849 RepID=A0A0P8X4X1_9CLOT|nr:S8/S53 family peptidase [Oxobacter pfennigii]KPU45828.1 hypothetical protein OXPF_06170 [Oxobacter pfennigii]
MFIYKENEPEFEKSRILQYLKASYIGKGKSIIVLDDGGLPRKETKVILPFNDYKKEVDHKSDVCAVVREVLPDVDIYAINWFGGKVKNEEETKWLEDHAHEIDVINCSFSFAVGNSDKDLWERIERLNIPVVCSSGNDCSSIMKL